MKVISTNWSRLACPALAEPTRAFKNLPQQRKLIGECGQQLGDRVGDYGTAAFADDIDRERPVAFGALVKRRPGQPDEPVAASMADWIWDRVADFGGVDPRPAPLKTEVPPADLPAVPGRP